MARGTRADVMRHARPRDRAVRAHTACRLCAGAHRWHGRVAGATQVHADARVVPRCRGAGIWRAHGLVDHGYRIGAVTQ